METVNMINCHTHTFSRAAVPDKFLPRFLMPLAWLLENKGVSNFLFTAFSKLQKHELALLIKKFHAFLSIGDFKSQLEIFKYLQNFYPTGTRFCVLPMDMQFMQAGTPKQSYISQLDELALIKQDPAYKDFIYPFIFVHPERKGILDIVKKYMEEKGFAGIKMYPPLGYYPFDEPKTLGEKIKKYRYIHGLSLEEFGQLVNASGPTVWTWENGKYTASDGTINHIEEIIGNNIM